MCDFQELYRHLIDDLLIKHCHYLKKKDFIIKTEDQTRTKKGKRVYLTDTQTRYVMKRLDVLFKSEVEISRIKVGNNQTVETLVNEEALLFAKVLRNEQKTWVPCTR